MTNSFVSQFKSPFKAQLSPRTDTNSQKYSQMLSGFESRGRTKVKGKHDEEKYTDSLFPPLYSSLFIVTGKMSYKKGTEIQWRRLSEIFSDQKPVLIGPDGASWARIILPPKSYASSFMTVVLNALSHCSCVL